MIAFANDDAISRIGTGLLDCTLPKPEWTHAAHFAATLWLARHRPDRLEVPNLAGIIRRYNEATATPNTDSGGYHETITIASRRAAVAFLGGYPADTPLHRVADDLLASPFGRSDWLLAHWRRDLLFSVAARRAWVAPDLAPLPFDFI
jgi:hypothetical protein